jgi:hypothetical protein
LTVQVPLKFSLIYRHVTKEKANQLPDRVASDTSERDPREKRRVIKIVRELNENCIYILFYAGAHRAMTGR